MPAERPIAVSLAGYLSHPDTFDLPPLCSADSAVEQSYIAYEESGREGATFNLYFGDMLNQPWFSVGLLPDLFPLPEPGREIEQRDLHAFVRGNLVLLNNPSHCIGLWYDAEDDQVFMDVVMLLSNKEEAVVLGTQYNQKSIFNLQTGEVVWLEGTGEPIE